MKKIIYVALLMMSIITFNSCSQNYRTRNFGGTQTIVLTPGEKLIEATWKENEIWYLTEPMEDDYIPKTKIFHEKSQYGVMEGDVKFIESR